MRTLNQSSKLAHVCYEIRGPVLEEAKRLEDEGHRILKLNIGNPAPFGFEAPEEILVDVIHNIPKSQGYCDSRGLYSARKAVMQYAQQIQIPNVEVNDIYPGNGVSELIVMVIVKSCRYCRGSRFRNRLRRRRRGYRWAGWRGRSRSRHKRPRC